MAAKLGFWLDGYPSWARSQRRLWRAASAVCMTVGLAGCQPALVSSRSLNLHQDWKLQPGDQIAGYEVVGGLGDVSVDLQGEAVQAPFPGRVEPHSQNCVIYSSPEVPAYLFRLCGLKRPRLGPLAAHESIGRGQMLHFAALRRQPNGTWALVEPSADVLEQMVSQRP